MPRRFQNNFTTTLVDSGGITDSATSMTLAANPTSLSLGTGEFVIFTLINGATREHVRATSVSGTAVSGMTRGVEGTAASAFPAGTTVNIHVTAEWLESAVAGDAQVTVSVSPAVYYQADFTISDATAVTTQRVLVQFEPNADFDLDDLTAYAVRAAVLTNGTITGVISTEGPVGGNFLLSYALG